MNLKTSRYITIGIYFVLFILVVTIWVWEIRNFKEFISTVFSRDQYTLSDYIYAIQFSNQFTVSILITFLGIGLFLRNTIGWILVTSWFYYVFTNFVRSIIEDKIDGFQDIVALAFIFIIPFLSIAYMNKFVGVLGYHKVKKKDLPVLNLISLSLGILFALFRIYKSHILQLFL